MFLYMDFYIGVACYYTWILYWGDTLLYMDLYWGDMFLYIDFILGWHVFIYRFYTGVVYFFIFSKITLFYLSIIICLQTVLLYQVLLSNMNDLFTAVWFQVFLSNINNLCTVGNKFIYIYIYIYSLHYGEQFLNMYLFGVHDSLSLYIYIS